MSWKQFYIHVYKVSPSYILLLASLRIFTKIYLRHFLAVVVMEIIWYTCAPSFTIIHSTVSKLEE